jgi:glycosyltransferase involved in cell wall biosynthesis
VAGRPAPGTGNLGGSQPLLERLENDCALAEAGVSLTLAVVRDYRAEGWPSMDLCADQLLAHLPPGLVAEDLAPPFRHVFGRLPFLKRVGFNADRLVNRHVLLPRVVRRAAHRADFVHLVDHSYAHLVNAVPAGRAGVYCHDLDAFRSILEPEIEPRPWWFRRLARRTLDGLKRAALVFHSTAVVGRKLRDLGIVCPDRLVYAPYGVAPEFMPEDRTHGERPYLLHVGSNIPRKRLDVLLDVFAAVRERLPELRLVQVGGPWPPPFAARIARLGIGPFVTQVRGLSREQLAELYRGAAAVLVTSDAEGFGLPVVEALACGAPVVASDLPTLREVGAKVVNYCTVADLPAWAETVYRVLTVPGIAPSRDSRLSHAARFTWAEHTRIVTEAYFRLAGRSP